MRQLNEHEQLIEALLEQIALEQEISKRLMAIVKVLNKGH